MVSSSSSGMLSLSLFVTLAVSLVADARVYQNLGDLPKNLKDFDFIVAGGGNAGAVIASRLSENRRHNVLLIEAGIDTAGVPELDVPAWATKRNDTEFNWRFVSEPMAGVNNRTIDIPRGRGLGGSTAINGLVYTRGSADDYDNWGRVTGDRKWGWKALWPYIERHEKFVGAVGGRDASGEFDRNVHGYRGNIETSLAWKEHNEHDRRVIQNARLNPEFPMVKDQNAGKPLGVTWMQSTIGKNGERYSSARGYLTPAVRERPNLTILLNTHALRVLPTRKNGHGHGPGHGKGDVDIRTIELGPREGGSKRVTLTASKEVVLSAGAIGSPHILLNSGIGSKKELKAFGIDSVIDLPDVGKGISEHVTIFASFNTVPLNTTTIDDATALAMFQQNQTGPLTQRFINHHILWFKLPKYSKVMKQYKDPSTGPTSPHMECTLGEGTGGALSLMSPHSRGSLTLASADPYAYPKIDYNLLSHPFDIEALMEGVRGIKRFYSSRAWEGYVTTFKGLDPDVVPKAEWEASVRASAFTTLHPVGSAAMSRKGGKNGVVDGDLRVKGAKGLRIVDSSVIPYVPTAHTQAPVYILAERAADIIKEAW